MYSINAVVVDFETRSRCDLKKAGGDNYVTDPSTVILCGAFICLQTGTEWLLRKGYPMPLALARRLLECDYVMAHNARFDQGIYEAVGTHDHVYPVLPADKWYCTAAQCRVNALPGGLDDAARAVTKGKHRKDHKGGALIRKLCIPQEDGTFNDDPELMQHLGDYCLQDARVTVEVIKATRLMTQEEHTDWLINERVNNNGVLVDTTLCKMAQQYAGQEQAEIAAQLTELTGGMVTKHSQHARMRDYVLANLRDGRESAAMHPAESMMVVYKKGEKKYSLDKAVRANILSYAESEYGDVPECVKEVVKLSDAGNKSSVSKFGAMLNRADPDTDRIHGAFMYAGAGQTKRYSSKGAQVHNFRRDCLNAEDTEEACLDMAEGYEIDNVMDTLSKMLRPALIPSEGSVFVVGDWAAIEGRFLPWLSGDPRAEEVLDIFRRDEDIYTHTAESMNLSDRQIGKVATLSLGFQGAVGAFNNMAKNYGVYLPEAKIKSIVKKWRAANPWAVEFWAKLEKAAVLAVRNPGQEFKAGRITYVYTRQLMDGTLFALLPNGEAIQYPFARFETIETPFGSKKSVTYLKASLHPKADAKDWPRAALYGGLQAENVTQAAAAALLREVLRELHLEPDLIDEIVKIVLHVHDEIVLEVPTAEAQKWVAILQRYMEFVPDWAEGLPLKAVPEIMTRYGK